MSGPQDSEALVDFVGSLPVSRLCEMTNVSVMELANRALGSDEAPAPVASSEVVHKGRGPMPALSPVRSRKSTHKVRNSSKLSESRVLGLLPGTLSDIGKVTRRSQVCIREVLDRLMHAGEVLQDANETFHKAAPKLGRS